MKDSGLKLLKSLTAFLDDHESENPIVLDQYSSQFPGIEGARCFHLHIHIGELDSRILKINNKGLLKIHIANTERHLEKLKMRLKELQKG